MEGHWWVLILLHLDAKFVLESICFLLKNHMKLQLHRLFCATKIRHDIRAKNI